MIVRILNHKKDTDKFYDCRNTCILEEVTPPRDAKDSGHRITTLILEFTFGSSIEVILDKGDSIYYMNDAGKTVHSDCRMLNR